jgi:hypothetical protein
MIVNIASERIGHKTAVANSKALPGNLPARVEKN